METVSLSLFRFDSLAARFWAFAQMGFARSGLRRTPDLKAWKLCGTGTGEGFTPVPNTGVYAILGTWTTLDAARAGVGGVGSVAGAPVWRRWRAHAAEDWTIFLAPTSVRGVWGGAQPFHVSASPAPGALAALTRATVKPRVALKFWGRVPDISRVIGMDGHVAFKIGIGEVPLLHQVTFSVWPDAARMADFARHDGPHARAIAAVRAGNWFSEELYARFRILGETGTWGGESPLKSLSLPPLERPAA